MSENSSSIPLKNDSSFKRRIHSPLFHKTQYDNPVITYIQKVG
jgi:hypothetical protein